MGSLGDFVKNAGQLAQGVAGAVKSTAEAGAAGLKAGGIAGGVKEAVNTGSSILKTAAESSPRIGKVFACGEKIAAKAASVIYSKSFSPKF